MQEGSSVATALRRVPKTAVSSDTLASYWSQRRFIRKSIDWKIVVCCLFCLYDFFYVVPLQNGYWNKYLLSMAVCYALLEALLFLGYYFVGRVFPMLILANAALAGAGYVLFSVATIVRRGCYVSLFFLLPAPSVTALLVVYCFMRFPFRHARYYDGMLQLVGRMFPRVRVAAAKPLFSLGLFLGKAFLVLQVLRLWSGGSFGVFLVAKLILVYHLRKITVLDYLGDCNHWRQYVNRHLLKMHQVTVRGTLAAPIARFPEARAVFRYLRLVEAIGFLVPFYVTELVVFSGDASALRLQAARLSAVLFVCCSTRSLGFHDIVKRCLLAMAQKPSVADPRPPKDPAARFLGAPE